MTKYILHGGNAEEVHPDNDSFFREMTYGTKGPTLVLLNYFSREDNEIEDFASQDRQQFLQNSENKELNFEIAEPSKLSDQLERATVMYMSGGDTSKLVEQLRLVPEIEKRFADKIIAGSSAGAYALTKYYWEDDTIEVEQGLGILHMKAFCHYKTVDDRNVEKLRTYRESLPLLILPNYKWVTFYL